jgi:hypothetical protein
MPHILVTSNRQTAGLAATLAKLFPDDPVSALALPQLADDPEDKAHFGDRLKAAPQSDLSGAVTMAVQPGEHVGAGKICIIQFPRIAKVACLFPDGGNRIETGTT